MAKRPGVPNRFGTAGDFLPRSRWVKEDMATSVELRMRLPRIVGQAGEAIIRVALPLIAAAVSLVTLYLAAVCTAVGQRTEDVAVLGSNVAHSDPSWAQSFLATLAHDSAIVVAIALPLLFGWLRQKFARGVVLAAAVLAANVTTQVLKHLVFARPDLGVPSELGTTNSLPSGTTTLLVSASLAIVLMLPDALRRSPASVALPMLAVVAGCATISLDWHRPADVIAAVVVVAAWFALAASVIAGMETSLTSRPDSVHRPSNQGRDLSAQAMSDEMRRLSLRLLVASGVCVVAVALLGSLPWISLDVDRHGPAVYVLSLGIVLVGSVIVVIAVMRAFTEGPGGAAWKGAGIVRMGRHRHNAQRQSGDLIGAQISWSARHQHPLSGSIWW